MEKIKNIFRTLKYRNFRLFFSGLAVSQIGIWMQNTAISWLVYDITKSPFTMGWIMFINSIPLLLVTPFGGVISDKFNKQKLLFIVQILFAIQALLLCLFAFSGFISIWNIILLGIFLNVIVAIDTPLRQSTFALVVDDKKDIGNAISINSCVFNIARFLGPTLAGLIIAKYNINICFLINFLAFLPIIFFVQHMNLPDIRDVNISKEPILKNLQNGFNYCLETQQINTIILQVALYCFLIMIFPMLMPIYTVDILHKNADSLGFLLGSAGIGSLLISLILAMKTSTKNLRKIIFAGVILGCFCFSAIGVIRSEKILYLLMFLIGFGSNAIFISSNTLLQSYIDDNKRGRVMGIYSIAFYGTTAFSSFLAGSLAHIYGISNVFIILGITMLITAVFLNYKLSKLNFKKQ